MRMANLMHSLKYPLKSHLASCPDIAQALPLLTSLLSPLFIFLRCEQCVMQLVHVCEVMTVILVVDCVMKGVVARSHHRSNPAAKDTFIHQKQQGVS